MSCAGNHEESRASDDDAAFRDYVLTRGTSLLRMATMLTGNRADGEDLVQAALAKTYLAWSKINDHAALDAYVRRAIVNTHISWWRRRRLEEFPTDELPDQVVADPARESDIAEVVRHALDRLPQRMRAAVMLRYFEDMTEPEIAATLGISLGTVKSTVSRAVARLRVDAELGEDSGGLAPEAQITHLSVFVMMTRITAAWQGLLPGARLVALSGIQVRYPEEVARCGAR
jgi:RNA polymerase sigma-70 factor (sigma-E family)